MIHAHISTENSSHKPVEVVQGQSKKPAERGGRLSLMPKSLKGAQHFWLG
jgi:hypothetical protein